MFITIIFTIFIIMIAIFLVTLLVNTIRFFIKYIRKADKTLEVRRVKKI